jgi:hypothetical protein
MADSCVPGMVPPWRGPADPMALRTTSARGARSRSPDDAFGWLALKSWERVEAVRIVWVHQMQAGGSRGDVASLLVVGPAALVAVGQATRSLGVRSEARSAGRAARSDGPCPSAARCGPGRQPLPQANRGAQSSRAGASSAWQGAAASGRRGSTPVRSTAGDWELRTSPDLAVLAATFRLSSCVPREVVGAETLHLVHVLFRILRVSVYRRRLTSSV